MASYLTYEEFQKLNEKEKRLTAARYALEYGHGGIVYVHQHFGISRVTITKGIKELRNEINSAEESRIRKSGGGRKRKNDTSYPGLDELIVMIASENPKLSLRGIVKKLEEEHGIKVSYMTVSRTLDRKENNK